MIRKIWALKLRVKKQLGIDKSNFLNEKTSDFFLQKIFVWIHSSEIIHCLKKRILRKPRNCFFFYFTFLLNECPGLWWHRQGHSLGKHLKVYQMKYKKNTWVFLIKNMAKFEALPWSILKLSTNIFFLKSEFLVHFWIIFPVQQYYIHS